jgi:two-component system sensor histidine kinase DesK
VEQIARKALAEVREAIGGYRSEGLVAEIDRAHRTLDAAGVQLSCESQPPKLSPAEETVLSLVLREAVTNIVRHAGARRVELRFAETPSHNSVVVRDDGRGGVRLEGNGLRGMRERVEALGGSFSVEATEGTRLLIQLPVALEGMPPVDALAGGLSEELLARDDSAPVNAPVEIGAASKAASVPFREAVS